MRFIFGLLGVRAEKLKHCTATYTMTDLADIERVLAGRYAGPWQWRRVHWARSGLGPTFNPAGRARSGQVRLLPRELC